MEQKKFESQYSGSYWGLLGRVVLMILISVGSIGIAIPWAITLVYRWVMSKVKINDKQVVFSGMGKQLFPAWILTWGIGLVAVVAVCGTAWMAFDTTIWYEHNSFSKNSIPPGFILIALLAGITVMAMAIRFHLKATRVLTANTHFEGSKDQISSFGSSYWQFIGKHIVFYLRLFITIGIALPWALNYLLTWFTGETKIDNTQLTYTAAPSFVKKWLPYWAILWVLWILQDAVDGEGPICLLDLAELFIQVFVNTAILRWVFSRITKNDQSVKNDQPVKN